MVSKVRWGNVTEYIIGYFSDIKGDRSLILGHDTSGVAVVVVFAGTGMWRLSTHFYVPLGGDHFKELGSMVLLPLLVSLDFQSSIKSCKKHTNTHKSRSITRTQIQNITANVDWMLCFLNKIARKNLRQPLIDQISLIVINRDWLWLTETHTIDIPTLLISQWFWAQMSFKKIVIFARSLRSQRQSLKWHFGNPLHKRNHGFSVAEVNQLNL